MPSLEDIGAGLEMGDLAGSRGNEHEHERVGDDPLFLELAGDLPGAGSGLDLHEQRLRGIRRRGDEGIDMDDGQDGNACEGDHEEVECGSHGRFASR